MAFVLLGAAGLWTHYSFPIVLAAAGLTFLVDWLWRGCPTGVASRPMLGYFALLCTLIVVSFLPWLPTAIASVRPGPKAAQR